MKNMQTLTGVCLMMLSMPAWCAGFNDNGDGTVTDFATGLMWQQGDAHNDSTYTSLGAFIFCDNLNLAGKTDWRRPSVRELSSIVDYRRSRPSIDLAYFPNTISGRYWSFTPAPTNRFVVSFSRGFITSQDSDLGANIRCVR
ncbi:MAG: DUF1566 domain-containing protein [Gammaproteobacteria bacterium]|nr:DUF1566 domain-containing protein [Gammaproteobacteria bacterium]